LFFCLYHQEPFIEGRSTNQSPTTDPDCRQRGESGDFAVQDVVDMLHGQVSRRLFQPLFPRWPETEVPVTHVTNGVHTPTWDSAEADRLWELSCGKQCWHGTLADSEKDIRAASDASLWQLRADSRKSLVEYVRRLYGRQLASRGASSEDVAHAALMLDDNTLTLGFARRFAAYKRPNLLLHDPARLLNILMNRERPVQLVIAGKAHPQDAEGQEMIRLWFELPAALKFDPGWSSFRITTSSWRSIWFRAWTSG
jgi:starch phosphorylase